MRILLADDHEVVRHGLRALLQAQPGWEICGEAATGREAITQAKTLRPDIAIIDLTMPELNGLEATRAIVRAVPRTQVLILTVHNSEEVAHEVLKAGARGYILKSDAGRDLVSAVDALSQGRPFFTSKVNELILASYLHQDEKKNPHARPKNSLTTRERELLQLLAEGRSNKQVASALHISLRTVESHRANIMRKLQLHSISELVLYAVRNHIIQT